MKKKEACCDYLKINAHQDIYNFEHTNFLKYQIFL